MSALGRYSALSPSLSASSDEHGLGRIMMLLSTRKSTCSSQRGSEKAALQTTAPIVSLATPPHSNSSTLEQITFLLIEILRLLIYKGFKADENVLELDR